MSDVLDVFSVPTQAWFSATFATPTPPQTQGWPSITAGEHTLICAPTGTGKTLAAFMWAIDRIMTRHDPLRSDANTGPEVLYVSPLRALAADIEKNLRIPLRGIRSAAKHKGLEVYEPVVGVRTGDTPSGERRRMIRYPPDILITTPESLFLMLTSRVRETLTGVRHLIIDEIHSLAGNKRGTHLMVSLERLEELCGVAPQRIALSATQRPLEKAARFLGGFEFQDDGSRQARPVTVVNVDVDEKLEVEVVIPVADMPCDDVHGKNPVSDGVRSLDTAPTRRSIWPAVHHRLLELIESHRSTLVFTNARRLCERLAARLNELNLQQQSTSERETESGPSLFSGDEQVGIGISEGFELVKAHHGSLSRSRRLLVEDQLKKGELRGLVTTSTLELGIDIADIDLVVQIASPGSVASAIQRIGRAGHQLGSPSRGKVFPKNRADLLEVAALVEQMHQKMVEPTRIVSNPLDVAAQQIVAMCALDDWPVHRLASVLRRSAGFVDLTDEVLRSLLDFLSGAYPAEEFAGLRPRITWDRTADIVKGRPGAQRLAVTNAGTIPDRGLFGVFLADGTRVGELDEEMVYESRVGERFLLGVSTWRIVDITFERVVVAPAPGELGKMPFWLGDRPVRSFELGKAIGKMTRELRSLTDSDAREKRLEDRHGCDSVAAGTLIAYLDDQAASTGLIPDDRTIVVERFQDQIGDWRVCVLTPFGSAVHAPWGMALQASLQESWGFNVDIMWDDNGIMIRLPEAVDEVSIDELVFDPEEVTRLVIEQLPGTALFASRFRECAARALLLPRRKPDRRTPLWQQRQRAADLLGIATEYPTFPMLLETTRECLNDVFDLPALVEVMSDLRSRRISMVAVDTLVASPFAQSLQFMWIAAHMYEEDVPSAERQVLALTLDQDLLRDLLGEEELTELYNSEVIAEVESDLQCLTGRYRARDIDEVHDLLRLLGPLSLQDIAARSMLSEASVDDPIQKNRSIEIVKGWVRRLVKESRAIEIRLAGRSVVADAGDALRLRDVAGITLPPGLPESYLQPVTDPLGDLCVRYARTHSLFRADGIAQWLGIDNQRVVDRLAGLVEEGRISIGGFPTDGDEFCDPAVVRRVRRRCLDAVRKEMTPSEPTALARFLPAWQGVNGQREGLSALADVLRQLQGMPIEASILETDVLPARISDYRPAYLDELCTTGEIVWVGVESLGVADARVRLIYRDQVASILSPVDTGLEGAVYDALRGRLRYQGPSFWGDMVASVQKAGLAYDVDTVLAALWDLVWNGEVTNDSYSPVRSWLAAGSRHARASFSQSPRRSLVVKQTPRGFRHTGTARRGYRSRLGTLSPAGPAAAAGRWSLVVPLCKPEPSTTEVALAQAYQLLDRYGIVTRRSVMNETYEGGFRGVYPVLKMLEERGRIQRGYFVSGLGAAQFALPGAVDRLRSCDAQSIPELVLLAATDPAQPYGVTLKWPSSQGKPLRVAGAYVILLDGVPVVELKNNGRSLVTFPLAEHTEQWIAALVDLVRSKRLSKLEISKVNDIPIHRTSWASRLEDAGFTFGYRGMTYRC